MTSDESSRRAILAQTSHELAALVTDQKAVIDAVVRKMLATVSDVCGVMLVSEDGQWLEASGGGGNDEETVAVLQGLFGARRLKMGESITGQAAQSGKAVFLPVTSLDQLRPLAPPEVLPVLERVGLSALLVIPLVARETVIGTLTMVRTGPPGRPFTEDDRRLAEDLAERAALAIDSARLHRDLERRVAERTRELEAANRELEAFSYSVSHDLRGPLRAIDGFSRLLATDYGPKLDDKALHYIERVCAATRRMAELIDGLLALSQVKPGPIRRGPVDLSELASKLVCDLRSQDPHRAVTFDIQPGLAVTGDAALLTSALMNLLENAWKFTSQVPTAEIVVGQREASGERVFFVQDNGAGFDMAYASKLFQPFQRLHDGTTYEGTGVGLATVERVVRRHGGRIWAEGAVGAGATFFFTLDG